MSDIVLDRTAMTVRFVLQAREEIFEVGDHLEWSRYVHRFTQEELHCGVNGSRFHTRMLRAG